MATIAITTDTNYSSLSITPGDNITIDSLATLTINTNTVNLAGISFTGLGGKVVVSNSSTTTPIFVNVTGALSVSADGELRTYGAPIQIGTGDGSTTTFALPSGAGGSKFDNISVCWVARGDTFRDGTSYLRTYAEVDSFTNLVTAYQDHFTHDTVANTITFRSAPPTGAAITIPNIQIRDAGGTTSMSFAGPTEFNYTSIARFDNVSNNSNSQECTLRNCGVRHGGGNGTLNWRRASGTLTMTGTAFLCEAASLDCFANVLVVLKNCIFTGKSTGGVFSAQPAGVMNVEKVLFACALTNAITGQGGSGFGGSGSTINDVRYASPATVSISASNSFFDTMQISPKFYTSQVNNSTGYALVVQPGYGGNLFQKISNLNDLGVLGGFSVFLGGESTAYGNTYSDCTFYAGDGPTFPITDGLRASHVYAIKSLGTTTTAQWQAIGYSGNPVVGGAFTANSTTPTGTGTVALAATSSIILTRGPDNRFNKFQIFGAQRGGLIFPDPDSTNCVFSNWTTDTLTSFTGGSGNSYNGGANVIIDRVLIQHATPETAFGLALTSGVDSPSMLVYRNVAKTAGRVQIAPFYTKNSTAFSLASSNVGPAFTKSSIRLFLRNSGDSATYEARSYGGVTGVTNFHFRDAGNSSLPATTFDAAYSLGVAMRRPAGAYTGVRRMFGVRLSGSNQTANYSAGHTVTQARLIGGQTVTLTGIVDSITSSEIRIRDITTSNGTIWPVFAASSVSSAPLINATTGYTPASNVWTAQDEYIPAAALSGLSSDLSSLPADSQNRVQFRLTVVRAERAGATDTLTAAFQGAAIDVALDPAYEAEFFIRPATISAPNLITGTRVRLYNETKNLELANETLASAGFSKTFDLLGALVAAGDTISLRAAWQSGLTAKTPIETLGVMTAGGLTFAATQENDEIYIANGIDGSAVTTLTADYPNVQIDISDGDGIADARELYAFAIHQSTTAEGITKWHGAITPIDVMNYRVNTAVVDLRLQNIGAIPLIISGARIYRDDNTSILSAAQGDKPMTLDAGNLIQYIAPQIDLAISNNTTIGKISANSGLIPALL
jgi:hypothetical protein